ncbi:TPA: hypothetical protein ACHKWX_004837, partial [Escherichia coli]
WRTDRQFSYKDLMLFRKDPAPNGTSVDISCDYLTNTLHKSRIKKGAAHETAFEQKLTVSTAEQRMKP